MTLTLTQASEGAPGGAELRCVLQSEFSLMGRALVRVHGMVRVGWVPEG